MSCTPEQIVEIVRKVKEDTSIPDWLKRLDFESRRRSRVIVEPPNDCDEFSESHISLRRPKSATT